MGNGAHVHITVNMGLAVLVEGGKEVGEEGIRGKRNGR